MISKKNIMLCGFMGCGKSTVGPLLAQEIGRKFIDADDYLAEKYGLSIPEIFAQFGESGFRQREHATLSELCTLENLVIATGGGCLTYPQNIPLLKDNGTVILLNTSFNTCYHRISTTDRPLVKQNSKSQLKKLFNARNQQYQQVADFAITSEDKALIIVQNIIALLQVK